MKIRVKKTGQIKMATYDTMKTGQKRMRVDDTFYTDKEFYKLFIIIRPKKAIK